MFLRSLRLFGLLAGGLLGASCWVLAQPAIEITPNANQNSTQSPRQGQPQSVATSVHQGLVADMPAIVLTGRIKEVPLAGRSEFWIDPQGDTSVSQLEARQSALPMGGKLFAPTQEGAQYNLHNKAMWIRFEAKNIDPNMPWNLEVGLSTVDSVSLHWRDAQNRWVSQYAGDSIMRSEWPQPGRTPIFKLANMPGETVTYFLRIGHKRLSFAAPITLYSDSALAVSRETKQLLLGAYSGWMLMIVLASVAYALTARDSGFCFCAVYILMLWLSQATYVGIAGQYLWPESVWWADMAPFFLSAVTMATGLAFIRSTLKPRQYSKTLDNATFFLLIVQTIAAFVDLLSPSKSSLNLIMFNSIFSLLFIYLVIYVAWRRGDIYARWLALGFFPVVLGAVPQLMRNMDLLATGFLTQYSVTLGATLAAPITLYAFSLRTHERRENIARNAGLPLQDPLTGLANMRALLAGLHGAITRARRYKNQYALVLVELTNYDWFAKEHGQEMADRALMVLADGLGRVARDVDVVARLESNQFLLLVEGPCTPASMAKSVTRIAASALKPSDALPVGATLKLRQTVALMPDAQAQIMGDDANDHLGWMLTAVESLDNDPRQTIRTLNF